MIYYITGGLTLPNLNQSQNPAVIPCMRGHIKIRKQLCWFFLLHFYVYDDFFILSISPGSGSGHHTKAHLHTTILILPESVLQKIQALYQA